MLERVEWAAGAALRLGACLGALFAYSCAEDFNAERDIPVRGTVGRELYALVCDRIGAQSLRVDVTGVSYRGICHADEAGRYAQTVDVALLPPLTPDAKDVGGAPVTREEQEQNRAYQVARIEALGGRREELIQALDAILPDQSLALRAPEVFDPTLLCAEEPEVSSESPLLDVFSETLSGLVDLHNDGTFAAVTRAVGSLLSELITEEELAGTLARLDARQGYRPAELALGVSRAALSYPHIGELVSALSILSRDSDPENPAHKINTEKEGLFENRVKVAGSGHSAFQRALAVFREELRIPAVTDAPLVVTRDGVLDEPRLSRPRNKLELAQELLLSEHPSFAGSLGAHYTTVRDARGHAQVRTGPDGVPEPFVPGADGAAQVDEQGQFVTVGGKLAPTPFALPVAQGGDGSGSVLRDPAGRAAGAGGELLYDYIDVSQTLASRLLGDAAPLFNPEQETVLSLLEGLEPLLGPRQQAQSEELYPPAPDRAEELAALGQNVEGDPATTPVRHPYHAFDGSQSPIVDLAHGVGALLAHPEVDPGLSVLHTLSRQRPELVARLVGLGLSVKAIADAHPEARIPEASTLWDEMLAVIVKMAAEPGLLEAVFDALAAEETLRFSELFPPYLVNRDEHTYYRDPGDVSNYDKLNLNFNVTTGKVVPQPSVPPFSVPVDRSLPDTGDNRSIMQRFLQLLHDANGLSVCTKEGAVAHLEIEWPEGSGIRVKLDYPTDLLTRLVCPFVGAPIPPRRLPQCAVLRIRDVTRLIVDVLLERPKLEVQDPCLRALMDSPLTLLVGGVDSFLARVSGIDGMGLKPSIPAVSRLAFFEAPFDMPYGKYSGDQMYPKTRDFLKDVIDPVPSTVCRLVPFTDTDGVVLNLRECDTFEDTLRGRDRNGLFPIEQLGFIEAMKPLARAFGDHGGAPLFVDLFDILHLHYGSPAQTRQECDPTAPKTDARWCNQDGLVSYEPLLAEAMSGDLFPALHEMAKTLKGMSVERCVRSDASTGACLSAQSVPAVSALSDLIRAAVEPAKNQGLTDRRGVQAVTLNDGTQNPQVTPLYLIIDALKRMDQTFAEYELSHPGEPPRLKPWRDARSHLVDTFFAVEKQGGRHQFKNPAMAEVLPRVLSVFRSQLRANCPNRGEPCEWALGGFAQNLEEVISGPITSSVMDLVAVLRKDPVARREVQRFASHLVNELSGPDANLLTATAAVDLLQVLDDSAHLDAVFDWVSKGLAPTLWDEEGRVVRPGAMDALLTLLGRVFAPGYGDGGERLCTSGLDPHQSFAVLLSRAVTPIGEGGGTPVETLMSVIADVNRADPRERGQFDAADYQNMAKEVHAFLMDPATGLEQVYEVIRQATVPR